MKKITWMFSNIKIRLVVVLLGVFSYSCSTEHEIGIKNPPDKLACNLKKEILLKVDFDTPIQIGDKFVEYVLPSSGDCHGKFGKGYYFQRPSRNFLPPEIANLEEINGMFEGLEGAELKVVKMSSPVGDSVLSVVGKGFRIKPIKTETEMKFYRVNTAITGSCFIKGTEGLKVSIKMVVQPCNIDEKEKSQIFKKSSKYTWIKDKYKTEFYPDQSNAQTITLTGNWQRIAAYAEFDTRTVDNRMAELELSFDNPLSAPVLINGFQYEQTHIYPYLSFAPTSWLPGKTSRPNDISGIELTTTKTFFENFPVCSGSVSFWAKIPVDCNILGKSGGFFNFGKGWHHPMWYMTENSLTTGGKEACYPKFKLPLDQWVHIVLSWDEKTMRYYVNGKEIKFQSRNCTAINEVDKYSFSIGKTLWENESGNVQMDEFYIFKRALNENEITCLYNRKEPLNAEIDELLATDLNIDTFFRNDSDAKLRMKVYSDVAMSAKLKWKMTDLPEQSTDLIFSKGINNIEIKFSPALLLPGIKDLQLLFYNEHGKEVFKKNSKIEIKGQLRNELVKFLSWGGEGVLPVNYLGRLNLNAVNTKAHRFMDEITRSGMFINFDLRNTIPFEANNFENQKVKNLTELQIETMKKHFNWYGTLLNSEAYNKVPMSEWSNYPQLMEQAKKELGFIPPLDRIKFLPDRCVPAENAHPDKNGIISPGKEFNTLWWFRNKGQTTIKLNAMNAEIIKSIAPNNLTWTEPPMSSGMFESVDMAGSWGYSLGCAEVLEEFRSDYAYARSLGKLFQPTLGMCHWVNKILGCKINGKSGFLSLTVDELSANTWIAIGAVPAHNICFWNVYAWFEGENIKGKYLTEKDSSERFGKLVKEQLYPAAILLRDMPMAQVDVGLLRPESTKWYSERPSWAYFRINRIWGRCLSQNQLNYDVLYEDDVTVEKLKNYNTIIFPMAETVSRKVYNVLQKVANTVSIVVDKYCQQQYPNMKIIDHKFIERMGYNDEPFQPCQKFVKQLYKDLRPCMDVWAEGEKGPVLVFERRYAGRKYIVVLNNHWGTGEFNKYADEQIVRGVKYQPYGVAQKALISFKNDAEPVVYEFLSSHKINVEKKNGRMELEVDLPSGGARILCVYPHEFKEITIRKQGSFICGKTGEFNINLTDSIGNAPGGRQVLELEIIDATGQKTDESGLYTMENGSLTVPVRFALKSPKGEWILNLCERSSGLKGKSNFIVTAP